MPLPILAAVIFSYPMANGQSIDIENPQAACAQLIGVQMPDTMVGSTEIIQANSFTPPGRTNALVHPAFCRVTATTEPQVNFEVWLPIEEWNGKYQGVGNSVMAGTISYSAMARALVRGYATASTDTGHQAPMFDSTWAMNRPDLIEDFGHRALHVTTVNAKTVTSQLFGMPPEYSYYVGCSKGGQQGLMEAQRYPEDFDGIIAGAPAADWTRFYAGGHLWYSQATLADEESYIPAGKLQALGDAVNASCDALDGIEDGIIQNPMACNFEPAELTCPVGTDNNSCLTPKQVTAVEKIWSGTTNAAGELIYPGLVPGAEAARGGWSSWVTGREPFASSHYTGGNGFFRNFVFSDPDWDFRTFDFDRDLKYALEKVGTALDANNPDLTGMRDSGAKLIVYHGWSDADISPVASINYFEEVVDMMYAEQTPETAIEQTQDFFRLFMVPGMGHCSGGPGPDRFDTLTSLEQWVEQGIAPERITASKIVDGEVTRTRTLCAYPETAVWDGVGNTDSADSFRCEAP
jgi:feruloyl esterase